jgi:hypothetical protein
MRIIDWDRLPPIYDRLLYYDKRTAEITFTPNKYTNLYRKTSLVRKILIIQILTNPNVVSLHKDTSRYHYLKITFKNGDVKYLYGERNTLIRKYPELYKIEKKITKTIIEVK